MTLMPLICTFHWWHLAPMWFLLAYSWASMESKLLEYLRLVNSRINLGIYRSQLLICKSCTQHDYETNDHLILKKKIYFSNFLCQITRNFLNYHINICRYPSKLFSNLLFSFMIDIIQSPLYYRFSPEALGVQFTNGLLCWLLQFLLLEATLHSLGGGEVPLLDMVAYAGYIFPAACVVMLARVLCSYSFCVVTLWECLCMGIFLVKTMKRILVMEVTSFEWCNSTKRNYFLLLVGVAQIPLLFWLGNIGVWSFNLIYLMDCCSFTQFQHWNENKEAKCN